MSEQIDTGGSAYPGSVKLNCGGHYYTEGMTLLDWFAGQVLGAITTAMTNGNLTLKSGAPVNEEAVAQQSYYIAEAMIAEKRKREESK